MFNDKIMEIFKLSKKVYVTVWKPLPMVFSRYKLLNVTALRVVPNLPCELFRFVISYTVLQNFAMNKR